MAKERFKKTKSLLLSLVSAISLAVIAWLILYGKIKAFDLARPLLKMLPKDEQGLTKLTEKILGTAAEKAKSGGLQTAAQKGSKFFETSQYAEPARDIRENVIQKVDEVFASVKDLPAQEVKIIKRQVCKEWFEEVATDSGRN